MVILTSDAGPCVKSTEHNVRMYQSYSGYLVVFKSFSKPSGCLVAASYRLSAAISWVETNFLAEVIAVNQIHPGRLSHVTGPHNPHTKYPSATSYSNMFIPNHAMVAKNTKLLSGQAILNKRSTRSKFPEKKPQEINY